jgi:hypothetical protein
LITLGIVHQIARMNFEETRQQHARGVGEMGTPAAFNLRQLGLAEGQIQFLLDGADDFLLCHFTAQAAKGPFHFAKIAQLFTELHIAICDHSISICNNSQ